MCSHNKLPNQGDILDYNNDAWTTESLVDQLFLNLVKVKGYAENDKKQRVTFREYYCQAHDLMKWIPIAKPSPEFVINLSDLTTKIISELKELDKDGSYEYVLNQAVGRIFENIDSRQYHLSIARKLKVILKP